MAAYAAVVSLSQLLKQLLSSDHHLNSLSELDDKVSSLQSSLEKISFAPKDKRDQAKKLAFQIRETIYKAQDTLESFLFTQNLISSSKSIPPAAAAAADQNSNIISLQEIIEKIDPIAREAKELAGSIKQHPQKIQKFSYEDTRPQRTTTKIVGQDKYKKALMAQLTNADQSKLQVLPISGMAGIGKTTLVRSLYEDEDIKSYFTIRAWVTVSQDYNIAEIFARILKSMETSNQKAGSKASEGITDERILSTNVSQNLHQTRYLIVIDDMWDEKVWDRVRSYLPDHSAGSRILLTTRNAEIAQYAKSQSQSNNFHLVMLPLNDEDSWTLFCYQVFGDNKPCPPNLEPNGRGISKNCGGLPLSLTVVGGLLSQERKTVEYWQTIEEDVNAAAGKGDEAYKDILALSYNHLPVKLKGCFLYMGAFPEDYEIFVAKLIKLWVAEGFLNEPSPPSPLPSVEQIARVFLKNLIDRNLVSVRNWSTNKQIKICGLHDTLRDLAVNECGSEKFFHSIRKYAKKLEEGAETQRRVSVHKNVLMCLEDVYESARIMTRTRSIVYAGSHHHHPMPSCLTFDLLRVLDAYTVYFIQFPHEVIKLIHLRYLALTYNGKLPSSLSELQKLQVLLVRRQPKIIFVGASFLPNEIWNMSQLRHLLLTETDLPNLIPSEPENCSLLLANLQTLSNVNAVTCTQKVLQNMPNLKKLGMWMESPGPLNFHLDELKQLEAFKLTVLNPIPKPKNDRVNPEHDPIPSYKIDFQPQLFFPETLRKLSLSGCGLAWEDMEVIRDSLPKLEVLKLQELAFQGEEWEINEGDPFPELRFLLLEYLDLKNWIADHTNFPSLESLIIKHCYDLEEMIPDINEIGDLQLIELIDCSPEAVKWAEEVRDGRTENNKNLKVRIYSSWK